MDSVCGLRRERVLWNCWTQLTMHIHYRHDDSHSGLMVSQTDLQLLSPILGALFEPVANNQAAAYICWIYYYRYLLLALLAKIYEAQKKVV
ncbi:hypothetical protein XELAEV_18011349mg [Xenopus laevis]|uniref:Uncharacterized protein n=1 Tax=Xenopus laevis TaxID=8355 RepID=A0A974DKI8_XENLA|nr:hypothetical protein XELAEV_18011349mg [Xenopus laevis]